MGHSNVEPPISNTSFPNLNQDLMTIPLSETKWYGTVDSIELSPTNKKTGIGQKSAIPLRKMAVIPWQV